MSFAAHVPVGAERDGAEQEATRIARRVTQEPAGALMPNCPVCAAARTPCPTCSANKAGASKVVRRQAAARGPAPRRASASTSWTARTPSHPLPSHERRYFEQRLGADLGGVRIHADAAAGAASRAAGARAMTLGQHIAFAPNAYDPAGPAGRELLAHELVHTLQDDGGTLRREPEPGAISDAELEALANLSPVRVESGMDETIEEVLQAANNGLIEIVTPAEFERQLRFRIERLGSTEFADSWTADESMDFAIADADAQRAFLADKWQHFIEQGYMAYVNDKAVQWQSAIRRMDAAFNVGNLIAKVTISTATMFIGGGGAAGAAESGGAAAAKEVTTEVLKREVEAVARDRAAEFAQTAMRLATSVVPQPDTDKDKKRKKKKDSCEMLWGLPPNENARIFEQRPAINGQTTVDHVRFRLDAGVPPPIGGGTDDASRAWVQAIGCRPDDAGHVLAERFGGFAWFNGPNGNIFPQDGNFNRGHSMRTLDAEVAYLHAAGCDTCVLIQLSYEPWDSLRPTHAVYFLRARMPGFNEFVPVRDTVVRNESRDAGCTA